MCFGISMSSDFMCKSLIPAPILFAATISQASSYMVLDNSQAYTECAPAFLANMLQEKKVPHQEKIIYCGFSNFSGIMTLNMGFNTWFFNTTIIHSTLKNELDP